jgi:hypothetical protein
MNDVELTRALERGEIPNGGFHHADHLRVAWVYLEEAPTVEDAIARIATTLRRFAASVGKPEKYSDPLTEFWMHQMAAARAVMPGADSTRILTAFPHLMDKDLAAPRPVQESARVR